MQQGTVENVTTWEEQLARKMEGEGKKDQRLRVYCKYSLESLSTRYWSKSLYIATSQPEAEETSGVTKTYSPFDKTIFRQSFRFSAIYYPGTSTTDLTDTDRKTGGLFYHYYFEHIIVPVTSSNTQKASIQEGTLTLWRYILQEHQFLARQHTLFN